jgi:hypothetical protein
VWFDGELVLLYIQIFQPKYTKFAKGQNCSERFPDILVGQQLLGVSL